MTVMVFKLSEISRKPTTQTFPSKINGRLRNAGFGDNEHIYETKITISYAHAIIQHKIKSITYKQFRTTDPVIADNPINSVTSDTTVNEHEITDKTTFLYKTPNFDI